MDTKHTNSDARCTCCIQIRHQTEFVLVWCQCQWYCVRGVRPERVQCHQCPAVIQHWCTGQSSALATWHIGPAQHWYIRHPVSNYDLALLLNPLDIKIKIFLWLKVDSRLDQSLSCERKFCVRWWLTCGGKVEKKYFFVWKIKQQILLKLTLVTSWQQVCTKYKYMMYHGISRYCCWLLPPLTWPVRQENILWLDVWCFKRRNPPCCLIAKLLNDSLFWKNLSPPNICRFYSTHILKFNFRLPSFHFVYVN